MTETSHKPTVLVVDDNWYNRDIFRMALENADYDISEAEDGQKALDLLAQHTYNLLVLDLQMPGIDGQTVLSQLREEKRHSDMRVLVVTANPHMATSKVDDLADHVMHKPIDVVAFAQFTKRLKKIFAPEEG